MDKEFLKEQMVRVNDSIMHDCAENKRHYLRKGMMIIDEDKSGELFAFVKENIKYDNLKANGKICELTIDESWDPYMKRKGEMKALDCWNKLVSAAYMANHGLLVINVSNIKLFAQCWQLKQLAKQEYPLKLWPSLDIPFHHYSSDDLLNLRNDLFQDNCNLKAENIMEMIEGFSFDGYVLINIVGIKWDDVVDYAREHCEGEFNAMWDFYHRLD